jgi:hypothetical protein
MTGAVVALVAALAVPVAAAPDRVNALCQRACADGQKTCNCSRSMYSSGGGAGFSTTVEASTGQSSGTCAKANVPPGQCVWMRYCFLCCPKSGFFGTSWDCLPDGTSVQGGAAAPGDCGERS